jgi:phosphoribosylformylglycinamidine cyclo-ligase
VAQSGQTYTDSGVDYSAVDPIKILAQKKAQTTAENLSNFNAVELTQSRGESAYVWEEGNVYRSLVIEGLGTKNLVADAARSITNKSHYDSIAQDCIAMIVNDLIVVGAMPQVVNAYWAVGDSHWMDDRERANDLINGWANACQAIGAAWGGGETPTLKDIIDPGTIDIGGSAIGIINPRENLVLGDKLADGDAIVVVESSGIHANGITFIRSMAEKNPALYEQVLSDGRFFGETILSPTHLYVSFVKAMLEEKLDIHYMVNITGHGWRKLMRAVQPFSYYIHKLPPSPSEFDYIKQQSGASEEEMYGNFNMGAGYAVYLPDSQADHVIKIASACDLKAYKIGEVKTGIKQVVIEPKNITFSADKLAVR